MDRHGRQVRLVEVGSAGQALLAGAGVDVRLAGPAAEVAARYLAGAGVGRLRVADPALAGSARAVDPKVRVEVDGAFAPPPSVAKAQTQASGGFDLRDPAARDVAAGAAAALDALRAILGIAAAEGA
jgi:hypothetical protein